MKGIFSALVLLAVAYYGGRFLVGTVLARDLMAHLNECHSELHLKDRINAPLSAPQIDALYDEWGGCVKGRSNFIDRIFGSKLVETSMDALREDRKIAGPYNQRGGGHAIGTSH